MRRGSGGVKGRSVRQIDRYTSTLTFGRKLSELIALKMHFSIQIRATRRERGGVIGKVSSTRGWKRERDRIIHFHHQNPLSTTRLSLVTLIGLSSLAHPLEFILPYFKLVYAFLRRRKSSTFFGTRRLFFHSQSSRESTPFYSALKISRLRSSVIENFQMLWTENHSN